LRREDNLEGDSGAEVAVEVDGVGLEAERMEGAEEEDSEEERRVPVRARLNLSRIAMVGGDEEPDEGLFVWKTSWLTERWKVCEEVGGYKRLFPFIWMLKGAAREKVC
jgi:hypothetical protein